MEKRKTFILSGTLITITILSLVYASFVTDNSKSQFDLGNYTNTSYNETLNAVQMNSTYTSGIYESQVFDTGSNVSFNNLSWEYQRIQCPENMSYINKLGGYCIDQYEASMPSANSTDMGNATEVALRNNPGTIPATSKPNVVPWVRISANSARTACSNAGKHLCTDEEWLGASNVQGQTYNLPIDLAVSPYYCVTGASTYCLDHSYESGEACNTGTYSGGASGCYSSEGVYDMTGNVLEWTNETVSYTKPCDPVGTAGWCYWNGTAFTTSANAKYGNDGVYFLANSTTGKAVLRGGTWGYGAYAGPFYAHLSLAPTSTNINIGFRCCSS